MKFDGKAFGQEIVAVTRAFIERSLAPLRDEITALKKELDDARAELAARPDVGALIDAAIAKEMAGRDLSVSETMATYERGLHARMLEADEAVAKAIASLPSVPTAEEVAALIPAPKDGESVDPETIKAMVDEAVAALPPAKDGASVTLDDVRPVVTEALKAAVDALPKPLDGKDGERGLPGADGKDGADVADALIDRDGGLVLTLTTGAVKALGVVVGKDGAPGKDGRDGFSLDDFDVVDGPTTFTLRFVQGDHVKEWTLAKPTLADAFKYGWKEGTDYARGQVVMWAGQPWLAMADTKARPETNADWTMLAKKARDGQDLRPIEAKTLPKLTLK